MATANGRLGLAIVCALWAGAAPAAELRVPGDHPTIAEALEAAVAGDTVTVARGTYPEAVQLKRGVVLQGEETAATELTRGAVVTGSGTLQRFTVTGTGFQVASSPDLVVRNNVFRNIAGTALRITGTLSAQVSQNTFHDNGTALDLGQALGTVEANLFVGNRTAVVRGENATATLRNNRFFANTADGPTGTPAFRDEDPLFVDPAAGDYHVQAASPVVAAAPEGRQGAYGGGVADPAPFKVGQVTVGAGAAAGTARVTWSPNLAFDVQGYRVSYGRAAAGDFEAEVTVSGGAVAEASITGLAGAATPPPAPASVEAFPGDGSLLVRWSAAAGATGYRVVWGTRPDALDQGADAADALELRIPGLVNGVAYQVAVRPYADTAYRFAVRAESTGRFLGAHSDEARLSLNRAEGELSAVVSAEPGAVVGFPALEDRGGCFLRAAGIRRWGRAALAVPLALLVAGLVGVLRSARGLPALLAAALLLPAAARAEPPRWAAAVKAGAFLPAQDGWDDHYDARVLPDFRVSAGARPLGFAEIGVQAGYRRAEGKVESTASGAPLGQRLDQTLQVLPVQAYLTLELRVGENQRLVPYATGGYGRYFYRHEVDEGPSVRGRLSGYHLGGGLKLLLDRLDPLRSRRANENYRVRHTHALLEAQWARVDDLGAEETDLGGWSLHAGLSLEL
ncbi:MAG: right-handed parallel beta-helix repeat-containing protein [Deferrisomatales bacterium]